MGKPLLMGVVNITPDSFSDGGQFNSPDGFKCRLRYLYSFQVPILDVGAQSTAPDNAAIGPQEEIDRFDQYFLPNLKYIDPKMVISIDTYRYETFQYLYKKIHDFNSEFKLIWNDISGILEHDLVVFLKKECPNCGYVYCHTITEDRELSYQHMESIVPWSPKRIPTKVKEYFLQAHELFKLAGITDRMIFDPGFGFSKSYDQNIALIKHTGDLIKSFDKKQTWVLGVSRKSFLQKMVGLESDTTCLSVQSEYLHASILRHWAQELADYQVIFRLHDPAVFALPNKIDALFSDKD